MRLSALIGIFALVACDQPQGSALDSKRVGELESRVSELELQIADIKNSASKQVSEANAKADVPPSTTQLMTHALVNTSFQSDRDRRYRSLQECEAAKEQLLSDWSADDELKRSRGVVFTSRPTPSCIPI